MELVVAALVTGVLTLAGVLVSNSRSRAVMEVKIDNLRKGNDGGISDIERVAVAPDAPCLFKLAMSGDARAYRRQKYHRVYNPAVPAEGL